jgi:ariadne-1
MTCKMCANEFCWLCLGFWVDHGQKTGGYYNCNKYEDLKKDSASSKFKDEEKKRNEAKNELDKYMFYFERYNNHDKSEKHARSLKQVIKQKIHMLHTIKKYPV